jgi:hypothetical protein
VQLSNLTYDISGYVQSGSFNTLSMLSGSVDLRIDHVTFTGDCMTGANGGHVEVDGSTDVIVEACVMNAFGRCGTTNGHQDHGIYLASGSQIVIRNNDIHGNSSRGIQFNTEGGSFGTLDQVTIELNRIHDNGHADYEDGIVMNATGTGTISNVAIHHNLFHGNYYAGLRQVGDVFQAVSIDHNTFFHNGLGSTAAGRSEANLDSSGSGANTIYSKNILVAGYQVLNDCFVAAAEGYSLNDDVVEGTTSNGGASNCIMNLVTADPMFTDSANGDFHTGNAAVAGYGAYEP